MTVLTRFCTEGDPLHETGRCWLGKACRGLVWAASGAVWMVTGAVLMALLAAPYVRRHIEEHCQWVSGADVEAVLLAYGAQRTETLGQYVDRMTPLVAKGIMPPEELHKEVGWMVCPTFLPVQP